jgi:hypothetical protein
VRDGSHSSEHAVGRRADRVAFVVYGTITVLAAVGGLRLESQSLKALQAAAVLLVVAVAAWLAHSMWRVVTARARQAPEPDRSYELHEVLRSWPIVAAGLPGAASMVLAAVGTWSVPTGLRVAQGLGIVLLFAAGLLTARLAGATRSAQLVYMLALPCAGLVIVALEVAAHHL